MPDTPPIADRIVQATGEAINSHLCDCEEECRPQRNRDAAVAVLRELASPDREALDGFRLDVFARARLKRLADEIEQQGGGK